MQKAGLLWGQDPEKVAARVSTSTSLAEAMKDAIYVQVRKSLDLSNNFISCSTKTSLTFRCVKQECVPEDKGIKTKVFKAIDDVLAQSGVFSHPEKA